MVAVIGAMSIETDGLKAVLKHKKEKEVCGFKFTEGKLGGKKVVVCCCGIGKVASSSAAAVMISLYKPEYVINLGVAGGAKPLRQGDIVVSKNAVQHDYDATADGLVIGQVHGFESPYIPCDEETGDKLYKIAKSLGIEAVLGTVATGDMFVNSNEKSSWIASTFDARAFDMESAAVAQVCNIAGVKYCALRAISDNGDDTAVKSFYEFVTEAARRSIAIVAEFIKNS